MPSIKLLKELPELKQSIKISVCCDNEEQMYCFISRHHISFVTTIWRSKVHLFKAGCIQTSKIPVVFEKIIKDQVDVKLTIRVISVFFLFSPFFSPFLFFPILFLSIPLLSLFFLHFNSQYLLSFAYINTFAQKPYFKDGATINPYLGSVAAIIIFDAPVENSFKKVINEWVPSILSIFFFFFSF